MSAADGRNRREAVVADHPGGRGTWAESPRSTSVRHISRLKNCRHPWALWVRLNRGGNSTSLRATRPATAGLASSNGSVCRCALVLAAPLVARRARGAARCSRQSVIQHICYGADHSSPLTVSTFRQTIRSVLIAKPQIPVGKRVSARR